MAERSDLGSKLKVEFCDPDAGLMYFTIKAEAGAVTLRVSYTPFDTLDEMVGALHGLSTYDGRQRVRVMGEPEVSEVRFQRENGTIGLQVCRRASFQHPDCRVLLQTTGSTLEICLPFWRALRNLQTRTSEREFLLRWRRPFPETGMERLSERLRRLRDR